MEGYLDEPGDGRIFPQIPAGCLVWALLMGKVLRVNSLHGVEDLLGVAAGALGVGRRFGDDALAYFTERLSVQRLRQALPPHDQSWARRAMMTRCRRQQTGRDLGYLMALACSSDPIFRAQLGLRMLFPPPADLLRNQIATDRVTAGHYVLHYLRLPQRLLRALRG